MSPGPAFLPLTTRGHHLPSSWTHFPSLHTPVTNHILSCSPFYCLYIPSSLTTLPGEFVCICLYHLCSVLYGSQVSVSLLSMTPALCCRLWCPVFCLVFCLLAILFIKIRAYLLLDPDPCFSTVPFSNRPMTEIRRQTWVQRGSTATSVREMRVWRSKPGTSGKSLLVGDREDLPPGLLLGRPGRAFQVPDALLGPRGVAGGLQKPGS